MPLRLTGRIGGQASLFYNGLPTASPLMQQREIIELRGPAAVGDALLGDERLAGVADVGSVRSAEHDVLRAGRLIHAMPPACHQRGRMRRQRLGSCTAPEDNPTQ